MTLWRLWAGLRASLWFVPLLLVAAAVALAALAVEADTHVSGDLLRSFPRLFGAGAEGSRAMLSTIAGSIMTIAGVSFSITIAALAQASSQYTPRILRNFMSDRANQVVLGVFVGIFAYCLVVLRTIRGSDDLVFVPSLAVLLAVALGLVGVAFFIYFIHHISESLQVSRIIDAISRETIRTIEHLFPEELGEGGEQGGEEEDGAPADEGARFQSIPAPATGYIQRVDEEGLLRLAREHRAVIRMEKAIGDFVVEGTPIAAIALGQESHGDLAGRLGRRRNRDRLHIAPGPERHSALAEAVRPLYLIDRYRTVDQDPSFGIQQIVDIALKALSPGINDTTTAVTCVDYLSAILARAGRRAPVSPRRLADGELRVIARGPTFETMLSDALEPVRRSASGNAAVLARMLSGIEALACCAANDRHRRALAGHVALVAGEARRSVPSPHDRAPILERADALGRRLLGESAWIERRVEAEEVSS